MSDDQLSFIAKKPYKGGRSKAISYIRAKSSGRYDPSYSPSIESTSSVSPRSQRRVVDYSTCRDEVVKVLTEFEVILYKVGKYLKEYKKSSAPKTLVNKDIDDLWECRHDMMRAIGMFEHDDLENNDLICFKMVLYSFSAILIEVDLSR